MKMAITKRQKITRVGKDVEEREHSYTVEGNVFYIPLNSVWALQPL